METAGQVRLVDTTRGELPMGLSATTLSEFRTRARRLFHTQQERVQRVEQTLANQVRALSEELLAERAAANQQRAELLRNNEYLGRENALLEQVRGHLHESLRQTQTNLAETCGEQRELRAELAEFQRQLRAREQELQEVRGDDSVQQAATCERGTNAEEVAQLRAERDQLRAEWEQAQRRIQDLAAVDSGAPAVDDLRRRFEMAVQEVRELKSQNTELSRQLATTRSERRPVESNVAQGFDWEAQKQQLLAELESDFEGHDPQHSQQRLTVEGTIRITDQVVAQKDKEIAELQRQLAERGGHTAKDPSARLSEANHSDEMIRKERETVARLQEEWRERLRKAEVDISVERAKIARERVDLEEKLRILQAERAEFRSSRGPDETPDPGKPRSRGRWLARLGLTEDET